MTIAQFTNWTPTGDELERYDHALESLGAALQSRFDNLAPGACGRCAAFHRNGFETVDWQGFTFAVSARHGTCSDPHACENPAADRGGLAV